ncbi:thiamine pyrophosphate enzyme, N-terminal TPP binding domain-containing protein [Mycena maculata]|uniref:Thiamine pyrophosphate enzyme, N-terminal TPP binding domain-containing protein n=1 Tax=Mycena maculata TaxID=230809 RepID=A0AAD7KB76_9AGAR|nr:thiamine pyrophosphate enzyme, N-terminal TPP binding domain-containing protein [Mycena maculata]
MYTTSSVFLQSLANAGITHIFANWGSDHPALLEDLQRQRDEGDGKTASKIVTCPNEMVALSCAQGLAQVTGKPAAVIVHVDVGTQALAGAVHNVDRGRIPALIYAGASPFSSLGKMKGSRNEWIMSIQDIPDQTAMVRQYMRFTSQIESGKVAAQVIHRSLQIATSHPKGPVYLWARREVMEEEVELSAVQARTSLGKWPSVEPAALSAKAASTIAHALLKARSPLIITSHSGRDFNAVPLLTKLSNTLAIPVVAVCPSAVAVPFSHPYFLDVTYLNGRTHSHHLAKADVILVLDSDVPWIPAIQPPHPEARVFVVDSGDPLKSISAVGQWHIDAEMMCNADVVLALEGINAAVDVISSEGSASLVEQRKMELSAEHDEWVRGLDQLENTWPVDLQSGRATLPNVLGVLRRAIERQTPAAKTLVLNEGITNYPTVWKHMRTEVAGGHITSGGASLGWSLAAAVGAHMGGKGHDLIVSIVGDGSFMFCVPSSAYWMARRYDTPFLTIIINNGGWKAPKMSMMGCHPTGHGSRASGAELSVGFGPHCPDYSQIAIAASSGWAWGKRVGGDGGNVKEELESVVAEAIRIVLEERRCAVLDCVLESI